MGNMNFKKFAKILLSFVAIIYFAYCTYFYYVQRDMLFPIEYVKVPNNISTKIPESSKLWIDNSFGQTESWYLPPLNLDSNLTYPLIIVAHGNGDVIDKWVNTTSFLRENGIAILLVEYPGYGRSAGRPNQKDITEVLIKSYDEILNKPEIDKNKITFLGQSVGGGAICSLAKKRKSASMILISTFTNVNIFASQYYLPKFLVKDEFDNLSVVSNYEKPLLLVHGENDSLIPISEAKKLKSAARKGELIVLEGGHNTIKKWRPFWEDIVFPFLSKNNLL